MTDTTHWHSDLSIDACPIFPGARYENWDLDDPAGLDVADVRPIRD